MWLMMWSTLAFGGYGDAVDGYPTWAERTVHQWTNAVRVDPLAFEADYNRGGCRSSGFQSFEKTPKKPLMWNKKLNEAARYHTNDMWQNNHFSHSSSDGTSFGARLARYYNGVSYGENIAYGYGNDRDAVTVGWMCSPGHRENMMQAGWDELGTGSDRKYYTQNFGQGNVSRKAIAMGIHSPENPGSSATFMVDFHGGSAPSAVEVMLNGVPQELTLAYGEANNGVYEGTVTVQSGCNEYWFRATTGGSTARFPENGSYGWGSCGWNDSGARWLNDQFIEEPDEPEEPEEPESETDPDGSTDDTPGGDDGPTDGGIDDGGDGGTNPGANREGPYLTADYWTCSTAGSGLSGVLALLSLTLLARRRA